MHKTIIFAIALCFVVLGVTSCSEDTNNSSHSTSDSNSNDTNTMNTIDPTEDSSSAYYEEEGNTKDACPNDPDKTEPGKCGCGREDKDINGDGEIDCPVRVIPQNALIGLEEIPGKCAEWDYPKHHIIEMPNLPLYGYEAVIDTEKYGISTTFDKSKASDTTKGINQAIKEYKEQGFTRIVLPPGHYPITPAGISTGSDVALILGNDVILEAVDNGQTCGVIQIAGSKNVYIEGGSLVGKRYELSGAKINEESGGIKISESNHIFINGMTIQSFHGDGIMILDYNKKAETPSTTDIIIANSEIKDVYRNGIAVVGTDGIRISNNRIHHTNGTAPQFGVDFEPNGSSRSNSRAIIDHNIFNDNVAGDIVLVGNIKNVFVEYNVFSQGDMDKYIDNPFISWGYTSWILYRNKVEKFTMSTGCGPQMFCGYGAKVDGNTPSFVVENDFPGKRLELTNRDNLCVKDNYMNRGVISAYIVHHLRLINNRVDRAVGKTYSVYGFQYVRGKASGNVICSVADGQEPDCKEQTELNKMTEDVDFNYKVSELF